MVVYCSHVDCLSSVALYRDLVRRGYRNVRRYSGGLLDWEDAGLPLEGEFVDGSATMTAGSPTPRRRRPRHPYAAEIEAERRGWYELVDLVRSLTPEECLEPGYYRDPDWTVRDVVAHLGTWLAEAQVQFERISAGTYEGHDVDIDALNAAFLAAMARPALGRRLGPGQRRPHAHGRGVVPRSREPTDEAAWWIRKSGGDHYAEHLDRLREWIAELIARRT